jgi:hypothetical protein
MEGRDQLEAMLQELTRRRGLDFRLVFVSGDGQTRSVCHLRHGRLVPDESEMLA